MPNSGWPGFSYWNTGKTKALYLAVYSRITVLPPLSARASLCVRLLEERAGSSRLVRYRFCDPHKLMSSDLSPAKRYLASQLERLMALPLDRETDVMPWLSESDKVWQMLEEQFPTFKPLDIFMYYTHDPDIRVRDSKYRDYQHQLVSNYVSQLREQSNMT